MNAIERNRKNWAGADLVLVVLGVWIAISPFVLGISRNHVGSWSNVAIGLAIIILGLADEWKSEAFLPITVPICIWLFLSPFLLNIVIPAFLWNNLTLAFVIIADAAVGEALHQGCAFVRSDRK